MINKVICEVTVLQLPFIDNLGMSINPWDLLGDSLVIHLFTGDFFSILVSFALRAYIF